VIAQETHDPYRGESPGRVDKWHERTRRFGVAGGGGMMSGDRSGVKR